MKSLFFTREKDVIFFTGIMLLQPNEAKCFVIDITG